MNISMYIYKRISYYLSWIYLSLSIYMIINNESILKGLITKSLYSFYISYFSYMSMLLVHVLISLSTILIHRNEKDYMHTKLKKVFLVFLIVTHSIYLILSILSRSYIRPITYFIVIIMYFLANYSNMKIPKSRFIPMLILIPAILSIVYDFSLYILLSDIFTVLILIAFIDSPTAIKTKDEEAIEEEQLLKNQKPIRETRRFNTEEEYKDYLNKKYYEEEDEDEDSQYDTEEEYKKYLNEKYNDYEEEDEDEDSQYDSEEEYKKYLNEKYSVDEEEKEEKKVKSQIDPKVKQFIVKQNRYINSLVVVIITLCYSLYILTFSLFGLRYNRFRHILFYGFEKEVYDNLVITHVYWDKENIVYDGDGKDFEPEEFNRILKFYGYIIPINDVETNDNSKIIINAEGKIYASVYPYQDKKVFIDYVVGDEKPCKVILNISYQEFTNELYKITERSPYEFYH